MVPKTTRRVVVDIDPATDKGDPSNIVLVLYFDSYEKRAAFAEWLETSGAISQLAQPKPKP